MAGEDLTSPSIPLAFRDSAGGLNSTAAALKLEENESPDLQNVDFNKFGSILKRNGYTALNTSAFNSGATWTSLHWYESSTETGKLMGTCGNKLATWSTGAPSGAPTDITGALTITAGNNNLFVWRTFLDIAFGTNGVDVPIKYSGSGNGAAMTVPTGLTKAKWLEVFSPNSYLFLANVTVSGTAHPTRVYWGDLNVQTFTDTNFNDVNRNDGQPITGMRMLGEELIIYKSRSIWKALYTGDRDIPFVFVKTRSSVGCMSGYSIQDTENGHLFLAPDGYYFFDGNNSFKVSDRITATFDTFEPSRFQYSSSCYQRQKNRYWGSFTLDGASTHNRCITWDSFNNSFSLYKGHNANCFATAEISGVEYVFFGDFGGFAYQADTGTNDNPLNVSTAIDAYFYTKWHDYNDIVNQKGTEHIYAYYQYNNGTLSLAYAYDFEDADTYSVSFSMSAGAALYGSAIFGTDTYVGSGGTVRRIDLTGRGRVVRFKYSNSSASETFQVNGLGALSHLETQV